MTSHFSVLGLYGGIHSGICISVQGFIVRQVLPECLLWNVQSCSETFNMFDQVWLGLVVLPFQTAWSTACCLGSFLCCFMKFMDRRHHWII